MPATHSVPWMCRETSVVPVLALGACVVPKSASGIAFSKGDRQAIAHIGAQDERPRPLARLELREARVHLRVAFERKDQSVGNCRAQAVQHDWLGKATTLALIVRLHCGCAVAGPAVIRRTTGIADKLRRRTESIATEARDVLPYIEDEHLTSRQPGKCVTRAERASKRQLPVCQRARQRKNACDNRRKFEARCEKA